MIRFAWLQSRTQTLLAAAVLAVLAVAAAITGVQLSHLYESLISDCTSSCDAATSQFLSHDHFLTNTFELLARAIPALIGVFWGAPLLAREFETGTYRLAWTQSVTRSRWVLTKLGLLALATVLLAGLLTLTITWWSRALDKVSTNQYAVLDRRDIAPIAYALFAFASGAFFGAVIRRTVPAMAATLAGFVLARVASALWILPNLLTPVRKTVSLLNAEGFGFASFGPNTPVQLDAQGSGPPNSWTLSSHIIDNAGHVASSAELSTWLQQTCPQIALPPTEAPSGLGHPAQAPPAVQAAFEACRNQAAHTFHLLVSYQPANRYWTFQWMEAGMFTALAMIAAAGCYWWVARHTS